MNKITVAITPDFSPSKIYRLNIKDHFDNKTFYGTKYTVLPFKGFSLSGTSITMILCSESEIDFQEIGNYFGIEIVFDINKQFYDEKNQLKITLIEE